MSITNFGYSSKVFSPKGKLVYEYNPLHNYRKVENGIQKGDIEDLITDNTYSTQLNFDLEHPVNIECQQSYDGSVNLILNDDNNQPRLINTRFTPRENNTYERVDRLGNTDTNLYDESEFEIDTSLLKKYINIPKVTFGGVYYGGSLQVGTYTFYFKLSDADDNETDIVAESGIVAIHMGSLDLPTSIRGGQENENSGKLVQFLLYNIDSGYDYVTVYYSRKTGETTEIKKINQRYRVRQSVCNIHITGNETTININDLNDSFFLASKAKTQTICQNMLFLGNVSKYTPNHETLMKLSQGFIPYYQSKTEKEEFGKELEHTYTTSCGYYNIKTIYNKLGYWNEEMYRFGIVYILNNGSLSPVYNIRGINNVKNISDYSANDYDSYEDIVIDYDTQFINQITLENSAGICRINESNKDESYFKIRHFIFVPQKGLTEALIKENIKGYFFVRQRRIPTILCQAFMIGKDSFSGIPAWKIKTNIENGVQKYAWVTESFLNSKGEITHDWDERMLELDDGKGEASVALCPEYDLDQAYFNNLFTGSKMQVKQVTKESNLNFELHQGYLEKYESNQSNIVNAKIISVPDSGLIRDGNNVFRAVAGEANSLKYQYICKKIYKPKKSNFLKVKKKIKFSKTGLTYEHYTVENKVQIVRGQYGPFLGVYDNKLISTNSLINIYIPGYEISKLSDYFRIRINCEDPYYPVSERYSISELKDLEQYDIYRGDCYLCQYTHRLNRNFQDPDAPTNDTIVNMNDWIDHYNEDDDTNSEINRGDVNAVRIGTYFTFKCYSSMNLHFRDWDRSYPSEESLTGNKRAFFPLYPLKVDGDSKIPESSTYNKGFNSTVGEKTNFLQQTVSYIKDIYQTRIIYSDLSQSDAFKNGFRVFNSLSYRDYPNQYGGIMKILEYNNNLLVIFEHGIGLAVINREALIPTDDGTKLNIGAIKPLSDTLQMITTDYGTQWPESVVKTSRYVYGVDTVAKKIWRFNSTKGFECISDFKVQSFLNNNITLGERELTPIIGIRNVKTHHNAYKDDIMFTYYDNVYGFEETVWNLCFNEILETFTTFYSWVPSYSANIDNVLFTYDRNTSKWINKLGMSTNSDTANGICMDNPIIQSDGTFDQKLYLKNRPLPDSGTYTFNYSLQRDNFGYWKYFSCDGTNLKITDYEGLLKYMLLDSEGNIKDPIVPGIQLNIRCDISIDGSTSGSKWDYYKSWNYGYYESQICLTLQDIYTNKSIASIDQSGNISTKAQNTITINNKVIDLPTFETDFWKHGFAGIIDVQEKIKPCFWYHKQHPFEFEYLTGNDNAGYKRFDTVTIVSNNVIPESIHYSIIGDSYDFADQKKAMYFRQEATKAFYQYNGADIIYDHKVFSNTTGFLPTQVTSSSYIEKDPNGLPLRKPVAYSEIYKDTLFPWIYAKQDTFNEIEDYYKKATSSSRDYVNITGTEIVWNSNLNQFSLCNHVKLRDIKEVGRTRGNVQYINDKLIIQITPSTLISRNNAWKNGLPKLVVNNIPKSVYEYKHGQITDNDFPPELGINDYTKKYLMTKNDLKYDISYLDTTSFDNIVNRRKEIKLMDKHLKTKVRYNGDKTVVVLATVTQFDSSYV